MKVFSYTDSEDAWVNMNRDLICSDLSDRDRVVVSNQVILYDVFIKIRKSYVSEDWDFTKTVNYTPAKWTSLVNNYLDRPHFEEVMSLVLHRELKKDRNYNITCWFSNKHGGGKGCLISCTFSRRLGEEYPILNVVMRASEFYKRGMFDLLLIHRIGQEVYGEDAHFGVNILAHQLWGGSDWLSLLTSVIPADKLFNEEAMSLSFTREVHKQYKYFQSIEDEGKMNYHSHRRAVRVIQGRVNPKRLLAMHCTL